MASELSGEQPVHGSGDICRWAQVRHCVFGIQSERHESGRQEAGQPTIPGIGLWGTSNRITGRENPDSSQPGNIEQLSDSAFSAYAPNSRNSGIRRPGNRAAGSQTSENRQQKKAAEPNIGESANRKPGSRTSENRPTGSQEAEHRRPVNRNSSPNSKPAIRKLADRQPANRRQNRQGLQPSGGGRK